MSAEDGSQVVSTTASRRELIATYRTLRLVLLGSVVLLAVSIGFEIVRADLDLRGSISAYFHSPSRSIFVGSLVAIGACVIAIRGIGREEFFLNLAGMLAPIVALVPVAPPGTDVLPDDLITNLKNNMASLIVVGLVATLALWLWPKENPTDGGRSSSLRMALLVDTLVIVAGSGVFVVWEDARPAFHYAAAITMFGCFGVVAAINWRRTDSDRYRRTYRAVTIGMGLALVVIGGYKLSSEWIELFEPWHTSVFWLEVIEIALFAWFWFTQTADRWNDGTTASAVDPTLAS